MWTRRRSEKGGCPRGSKRSCTDHQTEDDVISIVTVVTVMVWVAGRSIRFFCCWPSSTGHVTTGELRGDRSRRVAQVWPRTSLAASQDSKRPVAVAR